MGEFGMIEFWLGYAIGIASVSVPVYRAAKKRATEERHRIAIRRSLGQEVADRPDAIGRAVIRPATYGRRQWGGDR